MSIQQAIAQRRGMDPKLAALLMKNQARAVSIDIARLRARRAGR